MLAVGVSVVTALIFSAVLGLAIFVFIRVGSEDDPAVWRRPWARVP
jgi:hypothetical protein